jgi:hypothetical protein
MRKRAEAGGGAGGGEAGGGEEFPGRVFIHLTEDVVTIRQALRLSLDRGFGVSMRVCDDFAPAGAGEISRWRKPPDSPSTNPRPGRGAGILRHHK